jgi:parvulin-like peptidyl-prolyl isomerase
MGGAVVRWGAIVPVLAIVVGCGEEREQASSEPAIADVVLSGASGGEVVARSGGAAVTAGEVAAYLGPRGAAERRRFNGSLEHKKRIIGELLRQRTMVAEARKRGLHRDPAFRLQVEQLLAARLLRRLRQELVAEDAVSEAELERELARYGGSAAGTRVPKVRASVIACASEADARSVLAAARRRPGDYQHFVDLVARHSVDEATRARRGDLGFFAADDARVDPGVRKAAFGIKALWGLSEVFSSGGRWMVVMRTGYRPVVPGLASGRRRAARRRLLQRRRSEAVQRYLARQREELGDVRFEEGRLARLKVKGHQPQHRAN